MPRGVYPRSFDKDPKLEEQYFRFCLSLSRDAVCGIYTILCVSTNEIYVGQSTDIFGRWKTHALHMMGLSSERSNFKLRRACKRNGIENFRFSILEVCPPEILTSRELHYIDRFDAVDSGMNILRVSSEGMRGVIVSEVTRIRQSESQKRLWTPEKRAAQAVIARKYLVPLCENREKTHCRNISEAQRLRWRGKSLEERRAITANAVEARKARRAPAGV